MKVSKSMLGLIFSIIFAFCVLGGYYYIWNSMGDTTVSTATVEAKYQPVEIESVKTQAQTLLNGMQKVTDIPLSAPASTGRNNPFAGM